MLLGAMPLNRLLKLLRPGRTTPPVPLSPAKAERSAHDHGGGGAAVRLDRLDIQGAIIHHLEWCVQFNNHLSGEVAQVEPAEPLTDDISSPLGRWLVVAAERAPGAHPRFEELRQTHIQFHALAREALRLAREDRMDLASTLLNTEFERARAKVLAILREMQRT